MRAQILKFVFTVEGKKMQKIREENLITVQSQLTERTMFICRCIYMYLNLSSERYLFKFRLKNKRIYQTNRIIKISQPVDVPI